MFRTGQADIDEWITSVTAADILVTESQSAPEQNARIFERLSRLDHHLMVLPLLNVKEKDMFVILTSNSSIFGGYEKYFMFLCIR